MRNPTQKRESLIDVVVDICKEKLRKKIKNKIDNGVNPYSAYDQVVKKFKLDELVILTYDIEAEKANLSESLDLMPKEIEKMRDRIEKNLLEALTTS
ncbi:MAG: hypothetical protein ACFFAS_09550 [Promethearchaeota archaeon]